MSGLFVELRDRVEDGETGASGALGIIVVSDRVAEKGHDAVAEVAHDHALEARDRIRRRALITRHCRAPFLGIELRGERRRSDQIAKQDRQMPPLTRDHLLARWWLRLRGLRLEQSSALAAKIGRRRGRRATSWTGRRESGATFSAELASGLIIFAAFRAVHKVSLYSLRQLFE